MIAWVTPHSRALREYATARVGSFRLQVIYDPDFPSRRDPRPWAAYGIDSYGCWVWTSRHATADDALAAAERWARRMGW